MLLHCFCYPYMLYSILNPMVIFWFIVSLECVFFFFFIVSPPRDYIYSSLPAPPLIIPGKTRNRRRTRRPRTRRRDRFRRQCSRQGGHYSYDVCGRITRVPRLLLGRQHVRLLIRWSPILRICSMAGTGFDAFSALTGTDFALGCTGWP